MNKPFRTVGIGEILWDVFPDGPRFGGAPANYACHASALGAEAFMVSRVGEDELGKRAIATLLDHGVNVDGVFSDAHPTGTVDVQLDDSGKPHYEFAMDVAWDHLQWSDQLESLATHADSICFGTLGQRSELSRRTIQRFVAASPATALRIFDINLRPPFHDEASIQQSLALANVLKLNEDELTVLQSMFSLENRPSAAIKQLAERFSLQAVALTLGECGSLLSRAGEVHEAPGLDVTVKDTVGAGDSFTAAMTLGLLRNDSLAVINERASRIAAYVCSRPGATPNLPEELRFPAI